MLTQGTELPIVNPVTIDASALAIEIAIEAFDPTPTQNNGDGSRVFNIVAAVSPFDVTFDNLTIKGGDNATDGGGIQVSGANFTLRDSTVTDNAAGTSGVFGGGLHLTASDSVSVEYWIENSIISGNSVTGRGGGIAVSSLHDQHSLVIESSVIQGNTSNSSGGGVAVFGDGTVNINKSAIFGNSGGGGGIFFGHLTGSSPTSVPFAEIHDTTISGNTTNAGGGGISWNTHPGVPGGSLDIVNSTISGNNANVRGDGIEIYGGAPVTISHSTITANGLDPNGAGLSGGIAFTGSQAVSDTTLDHTILSGNFIPGNSPGTLLPGDFDKNSGGTVVLNAPYSIVGVQGITNFAIPADIDVVGAGLKWVELDPELGPLADNGGFVLPDGSTILTHAPLFSTSLPVDMGNPALQAGVPPTPEFDQRGTGFTRVFNNIIDIGAVEFGADTLIPAPRISTVIVSYSNAPNPETNPSASHDFANDTYDDPTTTAIETESLDGSGNQLRTVPVGGADRVSIVFDQPVDVSSDDLGIIGLGALGTLNVPMPATQQNSFDYDPITFTATWTYDAPFGSDFYVIKVTDGLADGASTGVTSNTPSAKPLDGEWTNPANINVGAGLGVSEFPSGDGMENGGDFTFVFTIFAGDADLNNNFDFSDIVMTSPQYDDDDVNSFFQGDFTGDGDFNFSDVVLISPNYEQNLISLIMEVDTNGDMIFDQTDIDWYLDPINNQTNDPLFLAFEAFFGLYGAIEISVV